MNKTTFIIVIACAVFALALTGCPGEVEPIAGGGGNIGFSSDVEGINAAFADPSIYKVNLFKDLTINTDDTLIIPSGKTLNIGKYQITFTGSQGDSGGIIVASDINAIDFSGCEPYEDEEEAAIVMSSYGILIAPAEFITKYAGAGAAEKMISTKTDGDADGTANAIELGKPKTIGGTVYSGDILPDTSGSFKIGSIPDTVENYYVINSNPSEKVTLDFNDKKALKNITVTSDTKIKNIGVIGGIGGFDGLLFVAGEIFDDDTDEATTTLAITSEVKAQNATLTKDITFSKGVSFSSITQNNFKGNVTFNGGAVSIPDAKFDGTVTIGASAAGTIGKAEFIKSVNINGNAFLSDATFSEEVDVNGTGIINDATFNGNVTIGNSGGSASKLTLNNTATFTDGKLVTVNNKSELTIPNTSPTVGIVIKTGGNLNYTGTVFSLKNAKAAGAADVNLNLGAATLSVTSTGGTLDLSNSSINLKNNAGAFSLGGSTAVILGNTNSIVADSYAIKGAGTLFSSLSTTNFNGNTIAGSSTAAVLTFNPATLSLDITDGKTGTLSNINVDLTSASAGSITFGIKGMLYLNTGGSITTGAGAENLAYGGLIVAGSETVGGSILVGTLDTGGSVSAGSILAGSVGTSGGNFIASGGSFAKVTSGDAASGSVAQNTADFSLDGGSASLGGSILIF